MPVTEAPCDQAVEPGLANTLLTALSKDDQPGGTAGGAAGQVGWNRPMAGKTGTTQQHKSAAFIGIVPQMAGAVITFDNSNSPRPLCDGAGAPFPCRDGNIFGGKTPAETWFGAMKPLLDGQPVQPLPPTDPRYTEGGAETKVPNVIGRAPERRPRHPRTRRLEGLHPHRGQPRRPRHRRRAKPQRHRPTRRNHPPADQHRRSTPTARATR